MLGVTGSSTVYKTADIMLILFKTLVHPQLEYCTVAWSPHYVKDKELPEYVQRRLTRMILELKYYMYAERLDKLKLWTLEERSIPAELIKCTKWSTVCLLHYLRGYLNLTTMVTSEGIL